MTIALSLEQFWHSPARQLLAYPKGDESSLADRWDELQAYGIDIIYSHGSEPLAGLKILGLGYCGVVLRVRQQGKDRVLKILRKPSPHKSLSMEADMLMRANTVGVGPNCIAHSDNFLLMDYVDGPLLMNWLPEHQSIEAIYQIVFKLIHQAYQLDYIGVDHGDLRCITSHAFVQAKSPILIDFSSASLNRRPANVTTLVQGMFISTYIAKLLHPWFPRIDKSELIKLLRQYKLQPSMVHLRSLLKYLGLA
ncbi:MAG: serine/threonine protein kinase [Leptolyngbya sp. SIO3F4]|nr:serine/threonine protein kinase [Leptolyngbya sp. SIO3F4]